jgi:hypothetical protein
MQVKKPRGFKKSFQSLDSSNNIQPHSGVTIKVPSRSPKIQFNVNTVLHMHFIIKLIHGCILKALFCPIYDQVADSFTKSVIEEKFLKLQSMLGVQEVSIKGGYALMSPSFSCCVIFVNPSILSQFVFKGEC